MKQFEAVKEEGKPLTILHPEIFRNECRQLSPGRYYVRLASIHNKASNLQFGWLFGSVYPESMRALNDVGYEFTKLTQVDKFWKNLFASEEIVNRETGEIMKLPADKEDFTTYECMVFVEKIREYCSEYLNYYISDPDPNWKQKLKENNINTSNY